MRLHARGNCARPGARAGRFAAISTAGFLLLTGCGGGAGQGPAGDAQPLPPGEGQLGQSLDEPKDSPALGDTTPRKLADRIGCGNFSPVLDGPAVGEQTAGRVVGTCRLNGQEITVMTFNSAEAKTAYLEVRDGPAVHVVGDDLWAVRVPSAQVASTVRERLGGEVRSAP